MGMIQSKLTVDNGIRAQIEQALINSKQTDSQDKELVVRLKETKNGTVEALVDKGANGNFFSRNITKAALQEKNHNNQAMAMAWLKQYATEGTTGSKLSENNIKDALSERKVATVTIARQLLAQGDAINRVRNAPHDNLENIAENMTLYGNSGDAGERILREHLADLELRDSSNPSVPRQLTTMLNGNKLNTLYPALRNAVLQEWLSIGQNLVKNGNQQALAVFLANTNNLKDVEALKNSLQSEARKNKTNLNSYSQVLTRMAQLTGIKEAKGIQSGNGDHGSKKLEETLKAVKFSSRADLNPQLQQTALNSALAYLKEAKQMKKPPIPPRKPALPDTTALANFFSNDLPVKNPAQFRQKFAEGIQSLVKARTVTILELNNMNKNLRIYGHPGQHQEVLKQLATSLVVAKRTRGAAPQPDAAPREEVVKNNQERFNKLKQTSSEELAKIRHATTTDQRFKNINFPLDSSVFVAPPGMGWSARQRGVIHANYIPFPEKKTAIATQYPADKPQSKGRFWRMATQHRTQMVLDLTEPEENVGTPYYPTQPNTPVKYGGMEVTLINSQDNTHTYQVVDTSTGQQHTVERHHFTHWKDHQGADVNKLNDLATLLNEQRLENVAVHCRAGVGRTCTVYSAAVLQNKVANGELTAANKDEVIDKVILDMRMARGAKAVQTKDQRLLLSDLVDKLLQNN